MTMANNPTPPDTPREVETVEPAGLDSTVPQAQSDAPAVPARVRAASPDALRFDDVVSGAFDAEQEQDLPLPTKRVLAPQADSPKLHKVLAQAGMGSRLEMEQLILEGRISVNGEPAHVGQRIQFGDVIKVNGKPVRVRMTPPPPRVLAYHKPAGEEVSHDDPQNRPTVFRRLPKLMQGKWQSVGRLDLNTEGLLLLTNDGGLKRTMELPATKVPRTYRARAFGMVTQGQLEDLMDGVEIDGVRYGSIDANLERSSGRNLWIEMTITEGKNREVRRVLEHFGLEVSRLMRTAYGPFALGDLPRGQVVIDPFTGQSLSREDLSERLEPYKRRNGLVDDFDVPVGLYLQAATPRDILARLLRNLKEIHRTQDDWLRLIAVLDRLLILLPDAWVEYRDRGLAWAEMGDVRLAVADLETYVAHAEDTLDRDSIAQRLQELRSASN